MPNALESGRVQFQGSASCPRWLAQTHILYSQKGHNFFDPQPAWHDDDSEGASVFLVCNVFHNWADEYLVTMLKHLRAAAGPKTQLVIVGLVMTSVCDEPATHGIPGAQLPAAPDCKSTLLMISFLFARSHPPPPSKKMMGVLNGQERTITSLRNLLDRSGWKFAAVHYCMTNRH